MSADSDLSVAFRAPREMFRAAAAKGQPVRLSRMFYTQCDAAQGLPEEVPEQLRAVPWTNVTVIRTGTTNFYRQPDERFVLDGEPESVSLFRTLARTAGQLLPDRYHTHAAQPGTGEVPPHGAWEGPDDDWYRVLFQNATSSASHTAVRLSQISENGWVTTEVLDGDAFLISLIAIDRLPAGIPFPTRSAPLAAERHLTPPAATANPEARTGRSRAKSPQRCHLSAEQIDKLVGPEL